jgi:hypothetical protein
MTILESTPKITGSMDFSEDVSSPRYGPRNPKIGPKIRKNGQNSESH